MQEGACKGPLKINISFLAENIIVGSPWVGEWAVHSRWADTASESGKNISSMQNRLGFSYWAVCAGPLRIHLLK